jgi:transcription termination factor Rho
MTSPVKSRSTRSRASAAKAEEALVETPQVPEADLNQLRRQTEEQLRALAQAEGITDTTGMDRVALVTAIIQARLQRGDTVRAEGTLEVLPDGYGFLRAQEANYQSSPADIYVAPTQVRRFALRTGLTIRGTVRPPLEGKGFFALLQVEQVNGQDPEVRKTRLSFDDLTPLHPTERLRLSEENGDLNMRVVDLITPIGKGQRGLIVSPPRAGKTILLQKMAQAILRNHPECYLIVLLIDERPEEVTEMRRSVAGPRAEVISSTFDAPAGEHIHAAEIVLEKAKRLVEDGRDVVIFLDSLTRLARAYNTQAPDTGKILSGGVAVGALERPKRFFGAARNIEEGGSLTILATALIDTGSRMDEVIFEEFKGTGNMELHLDRRLVDKRVWPAIDINRSGTRREELLVSAEELRSLHLLRRVLSDLNPVEAMELLVSRLQKTRSNSEFLRNLALR